MAKIKKYPKEDISIVWKADLCMHSGNCVKGSPGVFDPNRRPWIDPGQASAEEIIRTVKKCPSGALSIQQNRPADQQTESKNRIQVTAQGPYLVTGDFVLEDNQGNLLAIKEKAALCRCGKSKNKPFCDGTHRKIGFAG